MLDSPLIGLMEDLLLPGESRTFLRTLVVPAGGSRTLTLEQSICVVSVTSSVELPSLMGGRCATIATVRELNDESVTLRGERRVRIKTAKGREAPYLAQIEELDPERPEKLIQATSALLSALDRGATPEVVGWEKPFADQIFELVRSMLTPAELRELLLRPLDESILELAKRWTLAKPAVEGASQLETMFQELAGKSELTQKKRQQLWSELVAIQKRLDVYDPSLKLDETDSVSRLTKKLMQAGLPAAAMAAAKRELRLLGSMSGTHHDYSTYLSHLDFMGRLPWHVDPTPEIDFDKVTAALDLNHSGLEKVKRRVCEFLATRALGGSAGSMILCLAGPPGVGKTTIARAIAEAMGRKFVRIALGGVHDEGEIRGHRLSYVAAGPGRILSGIAQAGSMNAVVLLDELDKIGMDRGRSPGAALHEVLDPEQNTHFQDNFLGVPYDLSHVLFIATVNDLTLVTPTLRDRLEPVELEGYTGTEKTHIVRAHLLERLRVETGLPQKLEITDELVGSLIDGYTSESGVRQLKRVLADLCRGRALRLARARSAENLTEASNDQPIFGPVTSEEIEDRLGAPHGSLRKPIGLPAGVAVGLSVGPEGGALMHVEAVIASGRGDLKMTGRLGDVTKESVEIARGYLRAHYKLFGISQEALASDVFVHMPSGSVPKDGPSAGVAVFLAVLSALTKVRIRSDVAMTGEITLTGRVLPVGGVRAKLLAAERAGISEVLIPAECKGDIPKELSTRVVLIQSLEDVARAGLVKTSPSTHTEDDQARRWLESDDGRSAP